MIKVIRLKGIGEGLARQLSTDGLTYSLLLSYLGSPAAVYDFIETINNLVWTLNTDLPAQGVVDRFVDNTPHLRQEGEEGEMWDGQPVVCDGGFELIDGELWYSGMSFTHGSGVPVKRRVMPYNIIDWYRCEDMAYYTGAYNY